MRVASLLHQFGHYAPSGCHRPLRQDRQVARLGGVGQEGQRGAVKVDGARRGPQQPGQRLEQRGLAGAVRPYQGGDAAN
jgi:hypothetical protein